MSRSWKVPVGCVLALAVALGMLGPPAEAFSVCSPGWSCVFGDNGEQDGLWATNNGDYDHDMAGEAWNDRTRSAVNRGSGYMGLYRDSPYQGLVACLPPGTRNYHIPFGVVTGIRYHPSRVAACGAAPKKTPHKAPPTTPHKKTTEDKQAKSPSPKDTDKVQVPSDGPTLPPSTQPSASVLPLPQVAQGDQAKGQVPVAATGPESHEKKDNTATVVAIVGAGAAVVLLGLLVAGLLVARRKRGPVSRPRRVAIGPEDLRAVDRGLRLLAVDCADLNKPLPRVRAVALRDAELVVVPAEPSSDAPTPWKAAADGTTWRLPVSEITELTDDVRNAPAPFPLLVPVEPGTWVNLLAVPGPVSLAGSRSAVRKSARGLAEGLRQGPWSTGVRIRTVGTVDIGSAAEPETGTGDGTPEHGRVVFIADDMRAPREAPPGGAIVALGEVSGSGTRWSVRADGTVRDAEPVLSGREAGTPEGAPEPGDASANEQQSAFPGDQPTPAANDQRTPVAGGQRTPVTDEQRSSVAGGQGSPVVDEQRSAVADGQRSGSGSAQPVGRGDASASNGRSAAASDAKAEDPFAQDGGAARVDPFEESKGAARELPFEAGDVSFGQGKASGQGEPPARGESSAHGGPSGAEKGSGK
ncbi:peptidase inhibitor family I36 protein [Actinomadura gamaensis]|uniref:Peptidase inhibitor family I36 protein n=1 Tax=Actinomadura gamaensis TaxID=1763541 RepID=A0ABV9TZN2_9ACTN